MNVFYGYENGAELKQNEAFFILECETSETSGAEFPHTIKNFFFLNSTTEAVNEDALSQMEANYRDFFIVKEERKPYSVIFTNGEEGGEHTYDFESMLQMLLFFANNTQYGWVLRDLLLKRAEVGISEEEEGKIKKILLDSIAIFGKMQGLPTNVKIPQMEYSFEFLANKA